MDAPGRTRRVEQNAVNVPVSADGTMPAFAVAVPMYNEAVGAEAFVRAALPALALLPQARALIVVDDGSTDGTAEILDGLAHEFPDLTVLHHERNGGYGAALVTGAQAAAERGSDYVLFMDSDLTNPPDQIAGFIRPMEDGFDLIKACRYCPGGGVEGVPRKAYWISRIGNFVASVLFGGGVRDSTNGFRAIRTDRFLAMPLRERGFPIIMEELMWARRRNLTIANVPAILYSRSEEQRPTLFNYSLAQMWRYLKYALKARLASDR